MAISSESEAEPERAVAFEIENADADYGAWRDRVMIAAPPRGELWRVRTFSVIAPFGSTLFVVGPPS